MDERDLERLWTFPWFDRSLRQRYGLDPRRHIRYDAHTRTLFFVVRRSPARADSTPGRFAVDARTLLWLADITRNGDVDNSYVVLVEDWKAPLHVVFYETAHNMWDRIVQYSGADERYWWLDDSGEVVDGWLGPVLTVAPF
jgi:hypothetical protein